MSQLFIDSNATPGGSINTLSAQGGAATSPSGFNFDFSGLNPGAILFATPAAGQMTAAVQVDGTTITINGSNQLTASFGFPSYVNVTHAMSPYVVTSTDDFISVDATGGAVTIQLPNTTTSSRTFTVKDRLGQSSINTITVTTVGGAVTIDGTTSYAFTDAYESIDLLWNGTTYEVF